MRVDRSLLMPYPIGFVFDIIEQAEHYPRFIKWCSQARILERTDDIVWAVLTMRAAGLSLDIETRNPKRRPEWLQLQMVRGPLKRFEGEWRLTALNDAACRIAFTLDYEITDPVISRLVGPAFARMADTLVDAYVSRAELLYAKVPPAPLAAPAAASPAPPSTAPMPAAAAQASPPPPSAGSPVPESSPFPASAGLPHEP